MSSTIATWNLLALGLLLGMRHALEADHLAAVAALATRSRSVRQTAWQGIVWGGGHTLTLTLFGGCVLAMSKMVPAKLANSLELGVGLMLFVLGLDVLRRVKGRRMQTHVHRREDTAHFPLRAFLVGMMHGMAGSAALVLLAAGSAGSVPIGIAYVTVFGAGSILGMGALSTIIAIPMHRTVKLPEKAHVGMQMLVGIATMGLGALVIWRILAQ